MTVSSIMNSVHQIVKTTTQVKVIIIAGVNAPSTRCNKSLAQNHTHIGAVGVQCTVRPIEMMYVLPVSLSSHHTMSA